MLSEKSVRRLLAGALILVLLPAAGASQNPPPKKEWSDDLKAKWRLLPQQEQQRIVLLLAMFDQKEFPGPQPKPILVGGKWRPHPSAYRADDDLPLIKRRWEFFDSPNTRKKLVAMAERLKVNEMVANLGLQNRKDLEDIKIDFALLPIEGNVPPQHYAVSASSKVKNRDLNSLNDREKAVIRQHMGWFRESLKQAGG